MTYIITQRPTVKCGILEFHHGIPDALLFNEQDFIVIVMHSKRRSVYFSGYRWIVNTLTLTKSSLGVVCPANLPH